MFMIKKLMFWLILITWFRKGSTMWPCPENLPCYCEDPNRDSLNNTQGTVLNVVCQNQKLTSVPENIPPMVSGLDLSLNDITSLKNDTFLKFKNLINLDLGANALISIETDTFAGLSKLEYLDVSSDIHDQCDKKTNMYDPKVFSHLKSLKTLIIFSNNCFPLEALSFFPSLTCINMDLLETSLPPALGNLKQLNAIALTGGYLIPEIDFTLTAKFFDVLATLPIEQLLMAGLDFKSISEDAFKYVPNIKGLSIWYSKITNNVAYQLGISLRTLSKIEKLYFVSDGDSVYNTFVSFNKSSSLRLVEIMPTQFPGSSKIKLNFSESLPNLEQFVYYGTDSGLLYDLNLMNHPALHTLQITQNPISNFGNYSFLTKSLTRPKKYKNKHLSRTSMSSPLPISVNLSKTEKIKTSFDVCLLNKLPINLVNLNVNDNPNVFQDACSIKYGLQIPNSLERFYASGNDQLTNTVALKCYQGDSHIEQMDFSYSKDMTFSLFTNHYTNCSLERLKWLDVNFCHLEYNLKPAIEYEQKSFQKLSGLEILYMEGNSLTSLPENFFSYQTKMKILDLSQNKLFKFNFKLSNMSQLQILDLAYNIITSLDRPAQKMLYSMTKTRDKRMGTLRINLEGNPLCCSCKCIDFIRWLHLRNSTNLVFDYSAMTCTSPNNSVVSMADTYVLLDDLYLTCTSHEWLTDSMAVFLLFNIFHVVWSTVRHYRWKIRYLWYKYKLKKKAEYEIMMPKECYAFDAFVIFAYEDVKWVKEQLMVSMEDVAGYRLCVHLRDFPPGLAVIDNISAAFEFSKIVVVVLTNSFLKQRWCMYELDLAQNVAVNRGQASLVIIKMEELDRNRIPTTLAQELNTRTYLEWDSDPKTQQTFWQKLDNALSAEILVPNNQL